MINVNRSNIEEMVDIETESPCVLDFYHFFQLLVD